MTNDNAPAAEPNENNDYTVLCTAREELARLDGMLRGLAVGHLDRDGFTVVSDKLSVSRSAIDAAFELLGGLLDDRRAVDSSPGPAT